MNTYFRVVRIFSVSGLPWPASWLLSCLEQTNQMPSSISNSKAGLHAGGTTRSICLVLIGVVLMGAMVEGLARFALDRMSRIEHRSKIGSPDGCCLDCSSRNRQFGNDVFLEKWAAVQLLPDHRQLFR